MKYLVDIRFVVLGNTTAEQLDAHTDKVHEHLLGLEGTYDEDMTVSLTNRTVHFRLETDTDDQGAALAKALTNVRTAIHACGGATPAWETALGGARVTVMPSELVTA